MVKFRIEADMTVLDYFKASFGPIDTTLFEGIPSRDEELGWDDFPITSVVGLYCKEIIDKGCEFLSVCDGVHTDLTAEPATTIINIVVAECNVVMYG